ncbi:hypothetical protein [Streptomyces sp. DSM 40484]|uniref:hypothetical protein n=1 Tax=Streptomyces kroppenstedtii TaxID=3051181 RepID=UPI0028D28AB1|nr:hypothetical protein [Streptomyces sp. DSM 40484]
MKFEDGTLLRLRSPENHPLATLLPGVGVHHFKFRQQVETVTLAEGCNQVQVGGELSIEPSGRSPQYVGSFALTAVDLREEVPGHFDLSLPLTTDQILAMERERDGGDLQLMVDFRSSLPQTREHPSAQSQAHFRVSASEWERQIENVNRGMFFTVTVPLPLDDGPLADAAAHVLAARRQITAGEYPDAIRETRLALEGMRNMRIWPKEVTGTRNDQDQADRYGIMLAQLDEAARAYQELLQSSFNQASGVQHSGGVIARATWVRADAVALTGMAASLMHRLAEELAE